MIVKISYYDLLSNSKKKLNENKVKKILNATLECHMARPSALSYEVSAYNNNSNILIDDSCQ